MGSTNKTTYYELSQFIGTDKPAWMQDYNGDMLKIDSGINTAKVAADNAASAASNAQGDATNALTAIGNINTALETINATLGTAVGNINTINALIGNGTPTTSDQTIIGAINGLEASIAPREDNDNLANSYAIGEQFARGGSVYTALTSLTAGTAFASLTLNTDYKVSDTLVEQIADTAALTQKLENKFVLDAVVTSVNVETLATDTLADLGTKFYAALNTLKASLESDEIIELTNFSVAGFGTLQISNSSAGVITSASALASGYHFNTMDSEASKFNIREISLGNGTGNASLTTIATGTPSDTINRVYYDGTHVFGGTVNYLNYRKYKKISAI